MVHTGKFDVFIRILVTLKIVFTQNIIIMSNEFANKIC